MEKQHQLLALRPVHRLASVPSHPPLQHPRRGSLHGRRPFCLLPDLQVQTVTIDYYSVDNDGGEGIIQNLRARRLQDQLVGGALSKAVMQRRKKRNMVRFLNFYLYFDQKHSNKIE